MPPLLDPSPNPEEVAHSCFANSIIQLDTVFNELVAKGKARKEYKPPELSQADINKAKSGVKWPGLFAPIAEEPKGPAPRSIEELCNPDKPSMRQNRTALGELNINRPIREQQQGGVYSIGCPRFTMHRDSSVYVPLDELYNLLVETKGTSLWVF